MINLEILTQVCSKTDRQQMSVLIIAIISNYKDSAVDS